MRIDTVYLKDLYKVSGGQLTSLAGHMPFDTPKDGWARPAVIVVPGGGYAMVSKREAEPIAVQFLARGFQTFILTYQCASDGVNYPQQLLQLACAVDCVRRNAAAYSVNPDEIFAVGFSAGGHLVGSLSTDYTQAVEAYGAGLNCRLTACAMCYPVVSARYGKVRSYDNLFLGCPEEHRRREEPKAYLDEAVCERTAPAFLWTTVTDGTVPPMNALKYAEALTKQGILYELHVYPWGRHGLSTCDGEINPPDPNLRKASRWLDDCADFFRVFTKEIF